MNYIWFSQAAHLRHLIDERYTQKSLCICAFIHTYIHTYTHTHTARYEFTTASVCHTVDSCSAIFLYIFDRCCPYVGTSPGVPQLESSDAISINASAATPPVHSPVGDNTLLTYVLFDKWHRCINQVDSFIHQPVPYTYTYIHTSCCMHARLVGIRIPNSPWWQNLSPSSSSGRRKYVAIWPSEAASCIGSPVLVIATCFVLL